MATAFTFWIEDSAGNGFEATWVANDEKQARAMAWGALCDEVRNSVASIECVEQREAA